MRKVILYLAMSLDGFISDSLCGVQWLEAQAPDAGEPGSYAQLMQNIDTVLMGWNTYHQVITELSPGQWPYQGMTSYVFTHQKMPSTSEVRFVAHGMVELIYERRGRLGQWKREEENMQ